VESELTDTSVPSSATSGVFRGGVPELGVYVALGGYTVERGFGLDVVCD
jgi:hypothetical protein